MDLLKVLMDFRLAGKDHAEVIVRNQHLWPALHFDQIVSCARRTKEIDNRRIIGTTALWSFQSTVKQHRTVVSRDVASDLASCGPREGANGTVDGFVQPCDMCIRLSLQNRPFERSRSRQRKLDPRPNGWSRCTWRVDVDV